MPLASQPRLEQSAVCCDVGLVVVPPTPILRNHLHSSAMIGVVQPGMVSTSLVGHRVGDRYQVVSKLAEGGMAEIYLARTHSGSRVSKEVVVKRIRPHLLGDETMEKMFVDEARLALKLNHHNIAQVFEVLSDSCGYCMVMERLSGMDARQLVERCQDRGQAMPVGAALSILYGVCSGLQYAHNLRDERGRLLGIVHRDVSPSNIFVTQDGAVKLLDFGIAIASDRLTQTESGVMKGKIAYLAPEQVLGTTVDPRTDFFALGTTLYELLTGRRPFDRPGESELFVLQRISEAAYSDPRTIVPTLSEDVVRLIHWCLHLDPAQRPQVAESLLTAIEDTAGRLGIQLTPRSVAALVAECSQPTARDFAGSPTNDSLALWGNAKESSTLAGDTMQEDVPPPFAPGHHGPSSAPPPAVPETTGNSSAPPRRRRPRVRILAAIALVAGIGVAGVLLTRTSGQPSERASRAKLPPAGEETATVGAETASSPAGTAAANSETPAASAPIDSQTPAGPEAVLGASSDVPSELETASDGGAQPPAGAPASETAAAEAKAKKSDRKRTTRRSSRRDREGREVTSSSETDADWSTTSLYPPVK